MKLSSLLAEGMPSSVIKQKQKLGMMSAPEFKEYIIKLAGEKNRTPEEQAGRLERLHVVKPGTYTSKIK